MYGLQKILYIHTYIPLGLGCVYAVVMSNDRMIFFQF